MQTFYRFSFEAPMRLTDQTNKRFIAARRLLNAIRQGVGRAGNDIAGNSSEFGYLVGVESGPTNGGQRVRSASAIAKWHAELLDSRPDEEVITGTVALLLESAPLHPEALIEQLVVMAGSVNNIKLKLLGMTCQELDYEVIDQPITYTIDSYLPGELAPWRIRQDREAMRALVKATYPLGRDPQTLRVLSQNCGKALKRHLVENAAHHGLATETLNSAILIVRAYWIAYPFNKGSINSDRREACRIIFQAPLKLFGTWFAGSYRHKGMGLITEAPSLADKTRNGVFVL